MPNPDPKPTAPQPDEVARRGALVLRTLPILLIPMVVALFVGVLLSFTIGGQALGVLDDDGFGPLGPIVVVVIFSSALIILVRLGRPTASALALVGVWTLFTTLASLRAGVTAITPALLIIPICVAGLLIDGVAAVSLAALGTLLIASIFWLETRGPGLPTFDSPPVVQAFLMANQPLLSLAFWAALFWTVAALTSLLAGSLQRALGQSRAQAQALSKLSAELEARVAEQTAALLDQSREAATLEERTRLAREIHDTLAQGLTGIVLQLGAAQRALAAMPAEADAHLDLAQRMARESLAEARRSVWNLRAPALERGDLADALRSLAARPLHPGSSISFEQQGTPWPLSPLVEGALLRVAQEALVNVAKHAHSPNAAVVLAYTPTEVQLIVDDDGVGFDAELLTRQAIPAPISGGFGLLGMRERIAALGGTLTLMNQRGARVIAAIPRAVAQLEADRSSPSQPDDLTPTAAAHLTEVL